jgi:hypothetical protein
LFMHLQLRLAQMRHRRGLHAVRYIRKRSPDQARHRRAAV